jgi:3-oxoacyl-[acyl-carrier-protein] synthase II
VTGVGVVAPIGIGKAAFWSALVAGESRISNVRDHGGLNHGDFDLKTSRCCLITDRVLNTRAATAFEHHAAGRGAFLALEAASLALADAGIDSQALAPRRLGVAVGSTLGESPALERLAAARRRGDAAAPERAHAFCASGPAALLAPIAAEHRITGPMLVVPTACAAGNYAIGYALERVRRGEADVMLAGGTEPFSQTLHIGFSRMKLVAADCCRPFDRGRQGLLVSEGAGFIVLEAYERARRRNAAIYGEIIGYGTSCDAYHVTAPEPEGRGAALALRRALDDARVAPADIDYINAHGTGTRANDLAETRAIKRVFAGAAGGVPVSSIKSMIGHTMGAAAAIEAVACALVLEHQVVPPTINYREPDPECDLDYVPNIARELPVRLVVSNSYGFLGHNASLVMAAA